MSLATRQAIVRKLELLTTKGEKTMSRARTIVEIVDLLARLRWELEFFKTVSPQDRETFRQAIPGEQVGYIVSLLKAFYDEDEFREWLSFSRGKGSEK